MNDYKAVLRQAIEEFSVLRKDRQELNLKLAQKEQFIRATLDQLSDADRLLFEDWADKQAIGFAGLSASIRQVLSAAPRKWHTATQVRDALEKAGFDFTSYESNPLASVHSTLKRMRPEDAETTTLDGVMAWRWKGTQTRLHNHRRKLRAAFGKSISMYGMNPQTLSSLMTLKDMK